MNHKKLAMSVDDWNTEGRVLGSATTRQIVFLKKALTLPLRLTRRHTAIFVGNETLTN
jgi:hypothetical protein